MHASARAKSRMKQPSLFRLVAWSWPVRATPSSRRRQSIIGTIQSTHAHAHPRHRLSITSHYLSIFTSYFASGFKLPISFLMYWILCHPSMQTKPPVILELPIRARTRNANFAMVGLSGWKTRLIVNIALVRR